MHSTTMQSFLFHLNFTFQFNFSLPDKFCKISSPPSKTIIIMSLCVDNTHLLCKCMLSITVGLSSCVVCLDSAACLSWISSSFTCWSNPKQSNRRLAIQRCFPLQSKSVFLGLCNKQKLNIDTTGICQLRKDCNLVTMFFNLCWEPWGVYLVWPE